MTPCHHHQMQRKLIFDNDDMESLKRPGQNFQLLTKVEWEKGPMTWESTSGL